MLIMSKIPEITHCGMPGLDPAKGKRVVLGTQRLDLPASHWSKRAEEARLLADRAATEEIRLSWIRVAEKYEMLARQAEARARAAERLAVENAGRLHTQRQSIPGDSGR